MANKTIIYLTDSQLDETIAKACREQLLIAAGDNPIISVSQRPLDFGKNICVGRIGRRWINIYKQQLAGLNACDTEFIAIAEHDVMYTPEHFAWTPPDNDTFWYNSNCWFVQWGGNHPEINGMYSYWRDRLALSQLICDRKLLIKSIEERLFLIEKGLKIMRKLGEPGAFSRPPLNVYQDKNFVKAAIIATNGSCAYLTPYLEEHLTKFKSEMFKTVNSNLDIRHASNFTGPRRGNKRRYELPYWGKFQWTT